MTDQISDKELREWQALCDAATPNSYFGGEARTAMPRLIAEVKRLRAEIKTAFAQGEVHGIGKAGELAVSQEVEALRVEMEQLREECGGHQGNHLRTKKVCKRLRARADRLEKALGEIEWADSNGCIDGDCPHEKEAECAQPLRDLVIQLAEIARVGLSKARGTSG